MQPYRSQASRAYAKATTATILLTLFYKSVYKKITPRALCYKVNLPTSIFLSVRHSVDDLRALVKIVLAYRPGKNI